MKRLTFTITAILLTTLCFGQKGNIKGKIIDADSQKPLTTGIVILFGTTIGTMTNEDGDFKLEKIPTKKSEVVISDNENKYMQLIITNIDLGKDKKEIDLGIIPLIKRTDPTELLGDQCLNIDGKTYKTNFVDGDFRHIKGTVAIIYLDKPVTCD